MEGQLGEILSKLSSYNEFKPIQNREEISDKTEKVPKEKKRNLKNIIFNGGFAIATALSLNFADYLPTIASAGLSGYEVKEVGYQSKEDQELPLGVLTASDYIEDLSANYYGGSFSSLESQAMGSILPEELLYNEPGKRSVEAWETLIDNLNVAENSRYDPREGKTYCNFYLRDALRQFGVPMPVIYTDPSTGVEKPTLANNMYDMLMNGSFTINNPIEIEKEWLEIDTVLAQQMADGGYPVIIAVKNVSGRPGHVALVAPNEVFKNQKLEWNSQSAGEGAQGDFVVSQSGGKNGLLRWNDKHYSKDNGYSERKIFVNAEDLQYFNEQNTQEHQERVENNLEDTNSLIPHLEIKPQVFPSN